MFILNISFWLSFTLVLFCFGLVSALFNSQNFIQVLISLELTLVSISLSFIGFSVFSLEPKGLIYALVVIVVSACESCVGLALLVVLLKTKGNPSISSFYYKLKQY